MSHSDQPKTRPPRLGMAFCLLAAAGFLAYSGLNLYRAGARVALDTEIERVAAVTVSTAKPMELVRRLELTGEVRPWQEVLVYAKVPGQAIREVAVEKGDTVESGQVLVRLDEAAIRAKLREAQAALAAAEAGIDQAAANLQVLEKDRQRFAALYRENAVARRQLDHLQAQHEAAEALRSLARAQAEQARAVIAQLSLTLADHRIVSPMEGTVTGRFFDPGNLSSTERPILQIADTAKAKILCFVTEEQLPAIRPGIEALVRIDAHAQNVFAGRVSVVNKALSPATRSAEVQIHLSNPQGLLQPGMYARVTLTVARQTAMVVDSDAVLRMPGTGSDFVFAVEKGRTVQVNVVTGAREGRYIELRQGLEAGAVVVVEGHGSLRHGDPVRIVAREAAGQEGQGE